MFLTVLAGSLALGAGLLAAAGYSEGTLVAARTAALAIGWLLLLATLIGIQGARRARLAELGTTAVVLVSGVAVLYLSYFHWNWSELLPELEADIELIPTEPLAASPTFVGLPAVARLALPAELKEPPLPRKEVVDACPALGELESLQCKRCGGNSGVAWLLCQEKARLEYCEGRAADAALCPSAIPAATTDYVPPG